MRYFLIIFLFACTTNTDNSFLVNSNEKAKDQYTVLNQPIFPDDYHQIDYTGNWTHMTIEEHGKTGSYAGTSQDTARFSFWGYGVQIRTELMERHRKFIVIIDAVVMDTIDVQNPINTTHNLVYSYMELKPLKPADHNHVLELVPYGGFFVLNTLTIHYYVDPNPDDCVCDTTIINYIDKIRWKDSTIYNYKDTLIITRKTFYDTANLQIWINADSLIFELK